MGTVGFCQKWRPILVDTSKMANLQAQVVNRLSPRNLGDLGGDPDHGVGGGLVGQVVELGTGDRQLAAASTDLAPGQPQQQLVQSGHGLVICRTAATQASDPCGGLGVKRRVFDGALGNRQVGRSHTGDPKSRTWEGPRQRRS
jgi:hypothetical protein